MKNRITLSALPLLLLPVLAEAQQYFNTPEEAANAFAVAITQQDDAELTNLLGNDWREFLPPEGVDPEAVARFTRDWKVSHRIVQKDNVAHLNVGSESWQLPLPIVKAENGWRFDMKGAADEILTRAIGRNELSAIQAMHAYVDAQHSFYQMNHEYAQKFVSSEGKKDGLYWPVQPGEAPSPLGPSFSPVQPGMGYHGYHFRIITAQGKNTDDGEKDYLQDGKMVGGFALIAWPVEYGKTGIATFMINQQDGIWQTDLGPQTAEKAKAITRFDPGSDWQTVNL